MYVLTPKKNDVDRKPNFREMECLVDRKNDIQRENFQ